MREEHYKSKLSAFIDHELPKSDQQTIAEHLMQCPDCRAEHGRLKLAASIAQKLTKHDAPPNLWNAIEASLNDREMPSMGLIPERSFFSRRGFAGFAVAAASIAVFVTGLYFVLFRPEEPRTGQIPQPG